MKDCERPCPGCATLKLYIFMFCFGLGGLVYKVFHLLNERNLSWNTLQMKSYSIVMGIVIFVLFLTKIMHIKRSID